MALSNPRRSRHLLQYPRFGPLLRTRRGPAHRRRIYVLLAAFRLPRVTSSSALQLFRHLRSGKIGVELERLVVYVGNSGRIYGRGLGFHGWGEGRQERFICDIMDENEIRKLEGEAWCTFE